MDPPCRPRFEEPSEMVEEVALEDVLDALPVALNLELLVDECVRVLLLSPSSPSSSVSSSSADLNDKISVKKQTEKMTLL